MPLVVVAHPRPRSRTHGVGRRLADLLCRELNGQRPAAGGTEVLDLALMAPRLLDRPALRNGAGGDAAAALDAVPGRPLVVLVTPTFRGTYSGLLKVFLDLLPRDGLSGSLVLTVTTAGMPVHRGAAEHGLRPVLAELGASVPVPGLCVLESELGLFDEVFGGWWARVGAEVAARLEGHRDGPDRPAEQVQSC